MMQLRRIAGMLALVTLLLLLNVASVLAATTTDWENATITVEGTGPMPANAYNAVQARMMARRVAIVDAYRQMAEQIKGVNVDATTTVENMMVTSDRVTTHVNALIQGARIVDEKVIAGGGYSVKMQLSIFGAGNSLASAVFDRPVVREDFPVPVESVQSAVPEISTQPIIRADGQSSAAASPSGLAIGGFTGLIVDCRGLGLKPVMSPVIKNVAGTAIYGYKNLDYDAVVKNGMAGYTHDINKAERAGSNPLVVKAVSLANHNGNPVLSIADANRVLIENGATGFLNEARVVFVR